MQFCLQYQLLLEFPVWHLWRREKNKNIQKNTKINLQLNLKNNKISYMRKLIITFFLLLSFYSNAYAEQVQTKFKFKINVPDSYVQIKTDLNFDQLSKNYKGREVDMNYIRQLLKAVGGNLSYEYFVHKDLTPNGNSINLNQIPGSATTIDEYKKLPRSTLCNYLQSEISKAYNGKNVNQTYCDFIGKINNNISEVFKMIHDGRLPNQKLIQYQFQFRDNLITATLGCYKENCDFMDKDLANMLKSINF